MISLISEIIPHKKQRIKVAVSMGVDSVAAYYYLASKSYNVEAIHYNHHLRSQNDKMQEQFHKLFNSHGDSNYNVIATEYLKKTENECRQDRLAFFKEKCAAPGSSTIIVSAHHLDDYVESYLMNCFRGHPEYKPMNLISDFGSFKIIHPFLLTEKKDFVQFVEKWKGGWLKEYIVQDETNDIIKGSRRNWIRKVIVPEMEKQKMSLKKHCKELIFESIKRLE